MKFEIMNKLLIIILIIFGTSNLFCQQKGYYYKYEFEDFLTTKTIDTKRYLQTIYKNIKYPSLEKSNRIEGVIRVLIYNHDKENLEIIPLNHIGNLDEEAFRVINIANEAYLIKSDEKYITEFFIEFDFHPQRIRGNNIDTLTVQGFPRHHKKIETSNKN